MTMSKANSIPVPSRNWTDLPEGKRMVTIPIDFTDLDSFPYTPNPPDIIYPEYRLGDFWGFPAQITEFDTSSNQREPLSEIRSVMFSWRPGYCEPVFGGVPTGLHVTDDGVMQVLPDTTLQGNLQGINVDTGLVTLYGIETGQELAIGLGQTFYTVNNNAAVASGFTVSGALQVRTNGALPFFANGRSHIRVIKADIAYASQLPTPLGYGLLKLTFCNFDVPPFYQTSYGTLNVDNG